MNLAVLGGIGTAVVAGWNTIKGLFSRVYNLVIVNVSLDSELGMAMMVLLKREGVMLDIMPSSFTSMATYVRSLERNQLVVFRNLADNNTMFLLRKRLILVGSTGREVKFLRGTFDRKKLVLELVNLWNSMNKNEFVFSTRFYVKKYFGSIGDKSHFSSPDGTTKEASDGEGALREGAHRASNIDPKYYCEILGYSEEELGQPLVENAIDRMSLGPEIISAVENIKHWKKSRDWYMERSIPWKRGWLMYGRPGTGKTTLVRALAQELNMPVFVFDLATMNNSDLSRFWDRAMSSTPCITLFEDIDGVFHGRDNVSVKGLENGVTFNGFLNTIDGVENTDGVFIVVTTNTLEQVDSALGLPTEEGQMSSRPGRVDCVLELGMIDQDGMVKMAKRIFEGFDRKQWEDLLHTEVEHTPAQFQEMCRQRALDLYWSKQTVSEQDSVQ